MDKSIYVGVYGIAIKNRKVLLIKNEDGLYDLPGGEVEYSKKPLDTLNDKFNSLVGSSIRNYKLMEISSVIIKSKKIHQIGIIYDIKVNPLELKCEWLCIDELCKRLITPLTYEVLILKGFVVK